MRKTGFLQAVTILLPVLLSAGCGGGGGSAPAGPTPAEWVGIRQFGTATDDSGNGIETTLSGTVLVTGETAGSISGATGAGSVDVFLLALDGTGATRWVRQIGSPGTEGSGGISVDATGNAYLAGNTDNVVAGFSYYGGINDVFAARYDPSGVLSWKVQFGTSDSDITNGVAADRNGNLYVAGHTLGSFPGSVNTGEFDFFLAKLSAETGQGAWVLLAGTPGNDTVSALAVVPDNNIVVVGNTDNTADFNRDVLIVKFSPDNAVLWFRQFGSAGNDNPNTVVSDALGDLLIAGETSGSMDGTHAGTFGDLFVVKLDRTTGDKVWAFQMSADNSANSGAFGVAADRQGNVYVAGRTAGNLDGQPHAGGYDGFLVKLDRDGNRLWTRLIGTPADDGAFDVSLDAAGNAYVTGSTGGALAGTPGLGGSDAFVAKFSPDGVRR